MNTFDETKIRRGQPANKAQFAEKGNSVPEASLPAQKSLPGSIGGWSVRNYKTHSAGPEGSGYTASVYKDGKRVMTVSNDGWGGADRFANPKTNMNLAGSAVLDEFTADARRANQEDEVGHFEPDMFVSLLAITGQIGRHAEKIGAGYEDIVRANIDQYDDLSDREKELLLDPSKF